MTLRSFINGIRYKWLHARQQRLLVNTKAQILRLLAQNGGRITFQPDPDSIEDDCVEYPISMIFYGKHFNPSICITDVYLNDGGEIMADGVDSSLGSEEKEFQVYPEHYAWVLDFIAIVLGYSDSLPGAKLFNAAKRFLRKMRSAIIRRFSQDMISGTYRKVKRCTTYDQAAAVFVQAGLVVAEYGNRNKNVGYASYNADGVRSNRDMITIEYTFRQTGPDSYKADQILHIDIG